MPETAKPAQQILILGPDSAERDAIYSQLCRSISGASRRVLVGTAESNELITTATELIILWEERASSAVLGLRSSLQRSGLDVPIIAVAALVSSEEALSCIRMGASDCISLAELARLELSVARTVQLARQRRDERRTVRAILDIADRCGQALRSAGVGSWSWYSEDDLMSWDDCVHALFGLSAGRLPNRLEEFIAFVHPQDRDRVRQELQQCIYTGGSCDFDFHIAAPDRQVRCLHARGSVSRDADGSRLRLTGIIWDNTDRERSERQLQAYARMQNLTAELGHRALERPDVNAFKTEALEAAKDVLQSDFARIEELSPNGSVLLLTTGIGWEDGWVGQTVTPLESESPVATVLRTGRPIGVDDLKVEDPSAQTPFLIAHDVVSSLMVPIEGRDAPYGVLSLDTLSQRDFNADEVHFLRSIANIIGMAIERSEFEEALRKEELRYRTIVETTTEWIWELDVDGRNTYSNPTVEQLLGYSPEEMLGSKWAEHVHPGDRQMIEQKLPERIGKRTGWKGLVIRWIHRDGSTRYLESHARPVFDIQNRLVGFMGSDRDVTERERSQATLKQFSAELQRSNRELEEFALIASHDLQEPLRKLRSFGELLQEEYGEALGGEGAEYLSEIVTASTRMQELVRSLLTLSRVGRKGLPFEEVDLNLALQAVLSDLAMRIKEVGGVIETDSLPTVNADPVQMRQLFQNLIANSLKFRRDEESPIIRIKSNGFAPGGEEICMKFTDNGIGFEQEHAEKVFAPFQRLHGRAKYEGTGMGLAICRKIVERHGGSILAESEPGQGTTFSIRMPVHHETASVDQ